MARLWLPQCFLRRIQERAVSWSHVACLLVGSAGPDHLRVVLDVPDAEHRDVAVPSLSCSAGQRCCDRDGAKNFLVRSPNAFDDRDSPACLRNLEKTLLRLDSLSQSFSSMLSEPRSGWVCPFSPPTGCERRHRSGPRAPRADGRVDHESGAPERSQRGRCRLGLPTKARRG
jgi:hypothetical protein